MNHEGKNETAQHKGLAPNPARFMVPVEMDRERVLFFDHTATFRIYQRYGSAFWRELYEHDPQDEKLDPKIRRVRIRSLEAFEFFLWAGLQRDAEEAGEELTIDQVREHILPMTIDALASALLVAIAATRRRPEKAARGNAPAGEAAEPTVQ